MPAIEVIPVRAFNDNYIWTLVNGGNAAVVDPGDAAPVLEYLRAHKLALTAILLPSFLVARRGILSIRREEARPAGRSLVQRYYLDFGFVVLAAFQTLLFKRYQTPVTFQTSLAVPVT